MERIDVSAIDIRDYAISQKWTVVKEALKDGLYVLNSPYNDYMQLIFPKDTESPYFQEMAHIALKDLSEINKFSFKKMVDEIREVNDDVVCLRYFSENKNVDSISIEDAIDSISYIKQMLLSAASSVVFPTLYHPKLNRTEALRLIKKTKFRHTEEGSFVLKVSHPCEIIDISESSDEEIKYEKPFSRNVFEIINHSILKISNAIEADDISGLFDNESKSENPIISYNFCNSLSKLFDEDKELPFQIIFNWSRSSLKKILPPTFPNQLTFPYSIKSKVEEVKSYFAPPKKDLPMEETFYGTVDTLDGIVDEDNNRSGFVTITVLYNNEVYKPKVDLSPEFYQIALEAHKKGNTYVKIVGDLKIDNRRQVIENIKHFNLM